MSCVTKYKGFKVKDLQYNNVGTYIRGIEDDGAGGENPPFDISYIDFGLDTDELDLTAAGITSGIYVSKQAAVVVSSSRNLYRCRAWVNMNTFDGAAMIKYEQVDYATGLTSALVTTTPNDDFSAGFVEMPGSLEKAQDPLGTPATDGYPLEIAHDNGGTQLSDRLVLEFGVNKSLYTPYLPFDPASEVDADGYTVPLGHLCFYAELESYIRRFDLPQGFASLFALLPSWEVNLVSNIDCVERSLGKLEDTVSMNFSVTTAENKSGYPKLYQSIIVSERNSEISGTLSDLDPAMFRILNNYQKGSAEDSTGAVIGTLTDMSTTSTELPSFGIVLRGWYQSEIMIEVRFPACKLYTDGNIDVHNVATRVPFMIIPVADGTMFVGGNKGLLVKKPIGIGIKTV